MTLDSFSKYIFMSHNDYQLAADNVKFTKDMLSPYSQSLINKHCSTEKLALNLNDKIKYVLHYGNYRLYLERGMKLVKIHRILQFSQSAWIKTYIDFSTVNRKEATSSSLQNLFKLFINSVFGKTMKCLRNRINLKLVTNTIRAKKLIARHTFQRFDIMNKDLTSITMMKDKVLLNRPIYLGFSILDLSKITIYQQIIAKYGRKVKFAYTDTDSFVYLIETKNIYDDIAANIDAFDTSDYPTTHPLHSKKNAKKLGEFKDECNSLQPHEFIGLRSKMYSLKLPNSRIKITAKGVSRSHILKNLKHKDYFHTIQTTKSSYDTFRTTTSQKHAVKTQEVNKLCLSAFDDKRYILPDGGSTLAHGHFRIPELNAQAKNNYY